MSFAMSPIEEVEAVVGAGDGVALAPHVGFARAPRVLVAFVAKEVVLCGDDGGSDSLEPTAMTSSSAPHCERPRS